MKPKVNSLKRKKKDKYLAQLMKQKLENTGYPSQE